MKTPLSYYGGKQKLASTCGHYDGYTLEDFEGLLKTLSQIKGKFLLSSYPSEILSRYMEKYGWQQKEIEQRVSVGINNGKPAKRKIEVLTANYNLK